MSNIENKIKPDCKIPRIANLKLKIRKGQKRIRDSKPGYT